VTPRAIGTIARTVVAVFAAAVFGALSCAVAASAQAPAKPSPKVTKPVSTITITGPDVDPPIVIRSNEDPTLYAQVDAQVEWMKSATGNVMPSTPVQLGPKYTVTMTRGTTKTAVYDLYPLVAGGPRAHRAAIGSQKAAWFFAPISMASGLEAAGVTFPTSSASGEVAPPTVATSVPSTSFSKIMAQSKIALGLATVAAAGVLVTLALAARRSRRLDRRRAMPPAFARLESVADRARGGTGLAGAALAASGARLRRAVPDTRAQAGGAKATGTARVKPPGQPTGSAPDAGSAQVSAARAAGTAAVVPPRSGPPLSSLAQPADRSGLGQSGLSQSGPGQSGPGQSGPAQSGPGQSGSGQAGPTSVWSMPAGRSGGQPSAFGTPRTDPGRPDQSRSGPAGADRPAGDARPPWPRATADAPIDLPVDVPEGVPSEIAVGTAHVVGSGGMTASALADASVVGAAKVTPDDDRAVGVAPAPRAPADDVIEPKLGRPYVTLGEAAAVDSASGDSASVEAGSEATGADEAHQAEPESPVVESVTDTSTDEPADADTTRANTNSSDGDAAHAAEAELPVEQSTTGQSLAKPAQTEPTPAQSDPVERQHTDAEETPEPPMEPVAGSTAEEHEAAMRPHETTLAATDTDADHADDAEADETGESAGDEADTLDGSEAAVPVTATSDDGSDVASDDAQIASSTAETANDLAANDPALDGDSESPAPAEDVPADSEDDHDAAAAGAAPSEPTGERP
jgi:hypothetical protein